MEKVYIQHLHVQHLKSIGIDKKIPIVLLQNLFFQGQTSKTCRGAARLSGVLALHDGLFTATTITWGGYCGGECGKIWYVGDSGTN